MKNTKQKIAIASVTLLLIFSVISGLVLPYLKNSGTETVDKSASQTEKIEIPNFQFQDRERNVVEFDQFRGKPVVINFWGTWCPYCVMELSDFDKAAGEYGDRVNFIFLDAENSEDITEEYVLEYLRDGGYKNISTYFDKPGYGMYMFGINSFPATIYIDSEGYFFNAKIGMTDYDSIVENIEAML